MDGVAESNPMEAQTKPTTENELDPPLSKLPDDVVLGILSRLPLHSLLWFKCVCKSWRAVISDQYFIRTHLHHQSTKSTNNTHKLLLRTHFSFASVSFETPNPTPKQLPSPSNIKSWRFCLNTLCSCDGLILMLLARQPFVKTTGESFVLWNPSIRAYKRISCPYEFNSVTVFGLCYDSVIGGYRVVVVSQGFETCVGIYDPNSDSWDMVWEPCYSIVHSENGVLVNGDLHWIMASKELGPWVIVCFDLVEKKFNEVPRPSFGDDKNEICLMVLMGCLCVYRFGDEKLVEIWAMKEYGKQESWTKLVVIPNTVEIRLLCRLRPLFFVEDGEIVLDIGERKEVVIYNPNDSTCRSLWRYGIGCMVIPYVESLVLPNGEGEIGRQHRAYRGNRNGKRW